MKYRLHVTPERCIGCRTCEMACAFSHPLEDGGLGHARLSVLDRGPREEGTEHVFVPLLCLQCETAACIRACPVQALVRNFETGAVEIVEERCVRCYQCVPACPFGNMHVDERHAFVYKCDLCGGEPKCALFCPTKTLEYLPVPEPVHRPAEA